MNTFTRTALLSLALATTGVVSEASAQSPLNQWLSYMPANGGVHRVDGNRDGRVDGITYDINRDGRADAMRLDTTNSAYLDAVALDTDYNGFWNEYIIDTNRDGLLDTAYVDSNGDGHMDMVGYDVNGAGYYSGWTALSPPAQHQLSQPHWQGPDRFGWDILAILEQGRQMRRGSVGSGGAHWQSGIGVGAPDTASPWLHGAPHRGGTAMDPNNPALYGTYSDTNRDTRRRSDGTLYHDGHR